MRYQLKLPSDLSNSGLHIGFKYEDNFKRHDVTDDVRQLECFNLIRLAIDQFSMQSWSRGKHIIVSNSPLILFVCITSVKKDANAVSLFLLNYVLRCVNDALECKRNAFC